MTDAEKRQVIVIISRTVSMLFVCGMVALAGCKRRTVQEEQGQPSERTPVAVVTNRMQDPVYREALKDSRREQVLAASARSPVVAKMEAMIAEVRASLPAGADDQAVKDELAKRPEWKALEEENARATDAIDKSIEAAREKIRQRMETEASDVKAVAEGRTAPQGPPK